ncbi:tetratricopeptide repeat protein [Massilia sp. H6]|uniref:O-linked N-acetylglucosamine transferase, SPINDLY family protein n=1 Tax=Massilia sp. H6 TaxID=2970464 RepID=UPI0021688CD7|nr:tetratricopeptide repeat protein [Massilia sp. H6]UVW29734.1 tetratricopeptide repeat protein [Massilia sp. H6]
MTNKPRNPQSKATAEQLEQHRLAVRRNPRDANAHALLGLAQLKSRRLDDGVASLRRALELNPKVRGLHAVLAAALFELGCFDAAAEAYRNALRFQDDADLHQGLADTLLSLERGSEAEAPARRAVALSPDSIPCLLSLGNVLHAVKQHAEAAAVFEHVLALDPGQVAARQDLGLMLATLGRHADAANCFRAVLESQPDNVAALLQLGHSHMRRRQHEEAVRYFARVSELLPERVDVLSDLAHALRQKGDLAGASALLRRALQQAPDNTDLIYGLLSACFGMGEWELAMQLARQALDARPSAAAHSVVLFILSHCCTDADELTREHFAFAKRWETGLRPLRQPHTNDRDPRRRLRIGMVSGDLYDHAVTNFVAPVFAAFKESDGVELYAYYNNSIEDAMTEQLRGLAAAWCNIQNLDDEAAERLIREDGIDILIDLSGHSALNRLSLFARKPAPLQATWIGYAGTTGLEAMDYILCDQFQVPEERHDNQFSEQIVRLPLGAPFMSASYSPPVNPLPALRNGYITFGSFHRVSKLNREVIRQWSKLLHAIPNAKMLLGGMQMGSADTLIDWFAEHGIVGDRLILRQRTHVYGFLEQHHEVDVCLSPFPYSGSTTIGHAAWMGVPTLATVGSTNPSYGAASFLAHLGLSNFIADDEAAYVALGVYLSQNPSALASLRATMRERFNNSLLGHPGVTAMGLECALRKIWERWCNGEHPAPLRVRLSDLARASS